MAARLGRTGIGSARGQVGSGPGPFTIDFRGYNAMNEGMRLMCKECGCWLSLESGADLEFCSPECRNIHKVTKEIAMKAAEIGGINGNHNR